MRRSTRTREAASSLSPAELSGLRNLVETDLSAVVPMLSNKPAECNVDTVTAELDHLCAMNRLSVADLLTRFFPLPMLSNHLVALGKSGKGSAPTLSARLASYWAAEGSKRPKVEDSRDGPEQKTTELPWAQERALAVAAVRRASLAARAVQAEMVQGEGKVSAMDKADSSPVTVADFAAQALINMSLLEAFPDDAMISEEDSEGLSKNPSALSLVCKHVSLAAGRDVSSEEVLNAIAYGKGKKGSRTWVLDPIDGTKGFIRQAQYAVCLALLQDGQVVLGCIGCPGLESAEGKGVLQVAVKGQGAFETMLDNISKERAIKVSTTSSSAKAKLTESYESGHTSHGDSENIAKQMNVSLPPLRIDSQTKYAVMARGDADLYLRMPQKTRRENIWDHAAGVLIVLEADGNVTDCDGHVLDFSRGDKLSHNQGIVVTNGHLHSASLAAIKQVLGVPFYDQAIVATKPLPDILGPESRDVCILFTAARDETGERWCPDCRDADVVLQASRVQPTLALYIIELSREEWKVNPGQAHYLRASPYNIRGVPTLAHYRNGVLHGEMLVEEQIQWDNVGKLFKGVYQ